MKKNSAFAVLYSCDLMQNSRIVELSTRIKQEIDSIYYIICQTVPISRWKPTMYLNFIQCVIVFYVFEGC